MASAAFDQAAGGRVRYDPRHMANRWVALAIVFVTRTSMGFQFQAVAAVAPLMVADLRLTWVQLGSLIGLYMLPGAVFALPGGVLGQRFGERRTVVASLALMVAGGLITALAQSFVAAAGGRLLSGVGAVLMNSADRAGHGRHGRDDRRFRDLPAGRADGAARRLTDRPATLTTPPSLL